MGVSAARRPCRFSADPHAQRSTDSGTRSSVQRSCVCQFHLLWRRFRACYIPAIPACTDELESWDMLDRVNTLRGRPLASEGKRAADFTQEGALC